MDRTCVLAIRIKLPDDVSQHFENALNMIVNFTDKSGNMKKELKKLIHETLSNLGNLIFILKSILLVKTEDYNKTRNDVKHLKDALENWKSMFSAGQGAPSFNSSSELTSRGTAVSPPSPGGKNLFSNILCGTNEERHILTVKPKDNQSTEEIKKLLKPKIFPVTVKIE
jgi:hypothetical protein